MESTTVRSNLTDGGTRVEQFARQNGDALRVIGLGTQDTLGEAEKFLDKYGPKPFTLLSDESFGSWTALNVSSQPTVILFARLVKRRAVSNAQPLGE